jgi:hypothetical protein
MQDMGDVSYQCELPCTGLYNEECQSASVTVGQRGCDSTEGLRLTRATCTGANCRQALNAAESTET